MSKFSQVCKGVRARKTIDLALAGSPEPVKVDVSVLSPDEEADVIRDAKAYARKKGVETPKPDDQEFELGHMVYTLARTVLDTDVPDSEERFFASAEELLASKELGRDGLVYLFEQQKSFQQEVAPGKDPGDSPEAYMRLVMEIAGVGSPGPFFAQKLGFQLSYVLFTANTLASLLMLKSPFGSGSKALGADTSASPASASSADNNGASEA